MLQDQLVREAAEGNVTDVSVSPPRRHPFERLRVARGWMSVPVAIAMTVRIALFLVADVGARMIQHVPFAGALGTWVHMDAVWYLKIVTKGYTYSPVRGSLVDFFPLYPLVVWFVQHALFWSSSYSTALAAGFIVSWVSFLAACILLYRLTLDRFDAQVAYGAVILLAVFPFSFYDGAPFSESLYLALAIAAFLGIERREWGLASVAALLAGAERPPGLIVGGCVVLAYGLDWLRTRHNLRANVLWLVLTPLGTASYMLFTWVRFGDPMAYFKTSHAGWHGAHLQTGAVSILWNRLTDPTPWVSGKATGGELFGMYAVLLVVFILSLVPMARLLGPAYVLYAFVSFALPIATYPAPGSLGRYLGVIFPTFIVFGYLLRNRPQLRQGVVLTSVVFLALCALLFANGYGLA